MNSDVQSSPSGLPVPVIQGGCWPNEAQRLLLRACLLDVEQAESAWREWLKGNSVDYLDAASYRLVPLLCHNLSERADTIPEYPRLKGIFRYFWARHQQMLRHWRPIVQSLIESDIPVILSKGAALNITAYGQSALRPMEDIDVLVPHSQALEAIRILEGAGWTSLFRNHYRLVEWAHACHFAGPGDAQLDLHWHLLHSDCRPEADTAFWERSEKTSWNGLEVRVLGPTDQLLHTCEHGARYNIIAPIRWLADAYLVLRQSKSEIDWDLLVETAREKDIALPAYETLEYLKSEFSADIPEEVLKKLQEKRPTLLARLYQRSLRMPTPKGVTFWNQLPSNFLAYALLKRALRYRHFFRDLPVYLELIHNLDRPLGKFFGNEISLAFALRYQRIRNYLPGRSVILWSSSHTRTGITWDTYAQEVHKGKLFCWTKSKAKFSFPNPGKIRHLTLKLPPIGGIRDDLRQRGFEALVDGEILEEENFKLSRGRLTYRMPEKFTNTASGFTLELRVSQPALAPGDTRHLGVPLCRICACR